MVSKTLISSKGPSGAQLLLSLFLSFLAADAAGLCWPHGWSPSFMKGPSHGGQFGACPPATVSI